MFFHDSPQSSLGVSCHGVSLIQNDQFSLDLRVAVVDLGFGKSFDDGSDDVDTSGIGGIQLQNHHVVVVLVHQFGTGNDGGGFPSPRRPIEKKIRQVVRFDVLGD